MIDFLENVDILFVIVQKSESFSLTPQLFCSVQMYYKWFTFVNGKADKMSTNIFMG